MKDLLIKHLFIQTTKMNNEFTKGNYVAIVWNNDKVSVIKYTPNTKRHLFTSTFSDKTSLKVFLKNNF